MGGTLLDYGGLGRWKETLQLAYEGIYAEVVAAGYPGEFAGFFDAMWGAEEHLWREATAGRAAPTLASSIAEGLRRLGVISDDALVARCAQAYGEGIRRECVVFPDAASTLAGLKGRGLKIGLISNTLFPGEYHSDDLARFGLVEHFDDLVFSSDVGVWKPQAGVFTLALERLGLQPEEAVFVGDRLVDDVRGAQDVGVRGVLIKFVPGEGPDEARGAALGVVPDARIATLGELPGVLDRIG